ncbi:sensor histidine kinase [Marinimicrobium sp. ARAG 43.8]|uniref:sensor histidine kinase n=1 Tax=Marinimicrobium sp. ARAG 43.8 TaxID=3418719 RepID=UPI003CEB4DAF
MPARRLVVQRLLLMVCFLLTLPFAGQEAWAQRLLGEDFPFQWYEDQKAALTLDEFLEVPASELTARSVPLSLGYTTSALWIRFSLPARYFESGEQWLELGPNFVDHLSLFFRPQGTDLPWQRRSAGDLVPVASGDIDYRFPVFVIPPLPSGSEGYDLVLRVQSSSAVLANATLWSPATFSSHAAGSTAFWSFYFGLAAVSSGLALLLALILRRRLLWSISLFSLSYMLVACIQGFVDWLMGPSSWNLQHHLTSVLTLLAYASLLWMSAEALGLKEYSPKAYTGVMVGFWLIIGLQISIPLNVYGTAIELQTLISTITALVFTGGALRFWWLKRPGVIYLLLGLAPLFYVFAATMALLSLFGLIPYSNAIYGIWQYILMVNMVAVLALAVYRIWEENRLAKEKHQLTRELQVEREASFHQRQFIGMVSHEFRTPLAIVSSALANLKLMPRMNVDQRHLRYDKIQRATDRLVQLTDNCLADARLSADKLYVDRQNVNLPDLTREAAQLAGSIGADNDARLYLTVNGGEPDGQEPLRLSADAGLLRIAISNLLDNAVKYSGEGQILVDVSQRSGALVVSVTDQGTGIDPEQAPFVFDRYRRASAPMNKSGGAGLGLHVARQIALAHGGDLALVENSPQGCRFELTLPQA